MSLLVLPKINFGGSRTNEYGNVTQGKGFAETRREQLERAAVTASERQQTLAAENESIPIIYGMDRIGGKVANAVFALNHWYVQVVWCHGPIEGVEALHFGDKDMPSGVQVTHYIGTEDQTVDPWLVEMFGYSDITYSDSLPGVAYSVIRAPNGTPDLFSVAATIKGAKVFDPRSGLTVWSDNPALCLADLLSHEDRGAGRYLDWATVGAVANACDVLIGGEKSRRIGLTIDSARDVYDWADVLRTYAGCWIVQRDSGLAFIADAPAAPVKAYRHADGNIIEISPIKRRASHDSPTVMIVRYTNTSALPWRDDYVIVSAPGVDTGAMMRRESEIPLPGFQSAGCAKREAIRRLNRLLLADISFSVSVFDDGVAIEPGDVVTISHPVGLADKPMRVIGVQSGEPGIYALDLIEYDPAAYSSEVVTDPTYPDTSLPQPGAPIPPTGLALSEELFQQQDGTWSSRIRATWTAPEFPFVGSYRVSVIAGATEVFTGTASSRALTWASPSIAEGVSYQVDVRTVSLTGAISAEVSSSIVALGKQLPPGNVPSLSGFEVGGEVRLQWSPAIDIDIWRYEIRYNVVDGSWATATLIDRIDALRIVSKGIPAGEWDFMVKAVDSVGNYSPTEARRTMTVTLDDGSFLVDTVEYDSPTLTNMQPYRLGRLAGNQRWVSTNGLAWSDVFTSALNSYTNPVLSYQPADSELLTETYDFGLQLTGNWTTEITVTDLVGSHSAQMEISTDSITFDPYIGLAAKRGGRFSRVRITAEDSVIIVSSPDLTTRIDALPRTENGQSTSVSSGPKTITLVGDYAAAKSITVTPMGTAPRTYAIDNVVVGTSSSFDVYIFDAGGTQVANAFYWNYEGV